MSEKEGMLIAMVAASSAKIYRDGGICMVLAVWAICISADVIFYLLWA